MWRLIVVLLPMQALAESVVATHTIRPREILTEADLTLAAIDIPDSLTQIETAVGQEARVSIYAGRPIRVGDIGPSAIIERNQIISLSYTAGSLAILTEGRALTRGGIGEMIEVMNLTSRSKVTGLILRSGLVRVGPSF